MKYALIGCRIFSRDIGACTATNKNIIHSFWLEQGLHDEPDTLRRRIQETIDEIEKINEKLARKYDAILLGYGLCSNGVVGLVARTLDVIIPRCDDCMALFLGSQKKYLTAFNSHKGIYWFNKSWVEIGGVPSKESFKKLYEKYLEDYDEDTAEYLVEVETSYVDNYENAFFIKSKIYDDSAEEKRIRKNAEDFNWKFTLIESDLSFLDNLLNGNWDDQFLICKPNQITEAEYTGKKISAKYKESDVTTYLENFISECNYPAESMADILRAGKRIEELEGSFIASKIAEYASDYTAFDFKKTNEELAEIAKKIDISEKTVWLVFYILLSKELKGVYAKNNIDNQIFVNSMMDLKHKTLECKETDGVWGIVPVYWYENFFALKLFALGRLQFEIKEFGFEYNKNGLVLSKTDKVMNIHIPSSGKLCKEDCVNSFKQAKEFFKVEVPNAVFVCHSWLLFPKNREILNEKSNILMFMDFFDIHDFEEEEVFANAWRIFGRAFDKDIVPKTTLQRDFYDYLVKGNKAGGGSGVFALKG